MLGGLFVDIGLLVVGGVAVVKGLANFLTKGVSLIKKLVVTGKMGGKTVNISLAGAATAAVTLTRSGMVKLKDLASELVKLSADDFHRFTSSVRTLTASSANFLKAQWWKNSIGKINYAFERNNLLIHFNNHNAEFATKFVDEIAYFNGAVSLMKNTGKNVVTVVDTAAGRIRKIDLLTGEFVVFSKEGNFISYFVRKNGRLSYITRQAGDIIF